MRIRTLDDTMRPVKPATLEEWIGLRGELLATLRFASSIDLLKNGAPLNARVFGTVEYEGFAVEKVVFQSFPGLYVCGNLFRPLDTDNFRSHIRQQPGAGRSGNKTGKINDSVPT